MSCRRARSASRDDYLRSLAHRLRRPPRGFVNVGDGPVKERKFEGNGVDWTKLPIPVHSEQETRPYVTPMNIVLDPETGFHNTSHAGTTVTGPRERAAELRHAAHAHDRRREAAEERDVLKAGVRESRRELTLDK
ncbi:MAG: UbiD family decarboxylase domain-containing protein [Betaproteobacteria bacterium]